MTEADLPTDAPARPSGAPPSGGRPPAVSITPGRFGWTPVAAEQPAQDRPAVSITPGRFGWTSASALLAHELAHELASKPVLFEVPELPEALTASAGQSAETATVPPQARRTGCLLFGVAASLGATVGAVIAGLILVVALSDNDGTPPQDADVAPVLTAGEGSAVSSASVLPSTDREVIEVLADALAEAVPPVGSSAGADFWSQILADTDLYPSGVSGDVAADSLNGTAERQTDEATFDFNPDVLASAWARLLTGSSGEPGAPLGSRIEGINIKAVLEAVEESVVIVNAPTRANPLGAGSGFVVSADGHIVTNDHVVRDAVSLQVRLFGGEVLAAELIASDPERDLAVLKVERNGLRAVRLGSTEGVEVGDEVIAIGNAFGIAGEPSVTAGIVSGLNRAITVQDGTRLVRLIQTDAAINPGNSGGPLVNAAGEVIGVNTAIRSGFAEGIGYAISIDNALPIIADLLEGNVQGTAFLGITMLPVAAVGSSEEFSEFTVPDGVSTGVLITSVVDSSPAQESGLRVGDVIVAVDGMRVDSAQALKDSIVGFLPGDRVELSVISPEGTQRRASVTLGTWPDS